MDTKARIQHLNTEIYGNGRTDLIDELFAETYVVHPPVPGYTPDREGLRQYVTDMHANLSALTLEVTHVALDGDLLTLRWEASAVHSGYYFGVPPTGKRCTTSGISICRLEDGMIVEEWQETDTLGLLQQMGVIPTEEAV